MLTSANWKTTWPKPMQDWRRWKRIKLKSMQSEAGCKVGAFLSLYIYLGKHISKSTAPFHIGPSAKEPLCPVHVLDCTIRSQGLLPTRRLCLGLCVPGDDHKWRRSRQGMDFSSVALQAPDPRFYSRHLQFQIAEVGKNHRLQGRQAKLLSSPTTATAFWENQRRSKCRRRHQLYPFSPRLAPPPLLDPLLWLLSHY